MFTKEFSDFADEEGKSGELSKDLFGEDLNEKIKEQLESNKITRHVVVGDPKSKDKLVDATHRKPLSRRRKRVVRRLPTEGGANANRLKVEWEEVHHIK